MAERRMLTKQIIDSDAFLDLPQTTRLLYYDLVMRADDDGFVNAPKKITLITGTSGNDIKILEEKKLIIIFESGIIVITHWKMHNHIRSDRYKPTENQEEKGMLDTKENGTYYLTNYLVKQPDKAVGRHMVDKLDTQVSSGKDRLVKNKAVEVNITYITQKFDEFWDIYPKKTNKAKAKSKFISLIKFIQPETIIEGAIRYRDWCIQNQQEPQFIPHAITWLNGERWNDILVDKVVPKTIFELQREKEERNSNEAAEQVKKMLRGEATCKELGI